MHNKEALGEYVSSQICQGPNIFTLVSHQWSPELLGDYARAVPETAKEVLFNSCFVAQAAVWVTLQDTHTFTIRFPSIRGKFHFQFLVCGHFLCAPWHSNLLYKKSGLLANTVYLQSSNLSKYFFHFSWNLTKLINKYF